MSVLSKLSSLILVSNFRCNSRLKLLTRNCHTFKTYKMGSEIDIYFERALSLAKCVGKVVQEAIIHTKNIETKSCDIDLVTETDQLVEKMLTDGLKESFPAHKFIGEETACEGTPCVLTNDPTWIIDPIDGTMNFVHGFPHCCISIALFVNAEPAIGIVYNPSLDQLFTAKKGCGAFLNGNKIHASEETNFSKALVLMELGTSRDKERLETLFENQRRLVPKLHGMRSLGSCALSMAMVALGCSEAYYEFGIHIWDIAAGELLVQEAGGVVIDPAGGEIDRMSRRVLCAGNLTIANELSKNLKQCHPKPRDD